MRPTRDELYEIAQEGHTLPVPKQRALAEEALLYREGNYGTLKMLLERAVKLCDQPGPLGAIRRALDQLEPSPGDISGPSPLDLNGPSINISEEEVREALEAAGREKGRVYEYNRSHGADPQRQVECSEEEIRKIWDAIDSLRKSIGNLDKRTTGLIRY